MKVSNWIVINGHCATRIRVGGSLDNIEDRVAFIEKTPRVRIRNGEWHDHADWLNWAEGPKGQGGSAGEDHEWEGNYGFHQPSRDWCDAVLQLMGYEISKCSECGVNSATPPHSCPFDEEIVGSGDRCNCCSDCENRCINEV